MKKQILGLFALLSLGLVSQCNAQDNTLKPVPCECKIDTLAIISAFLAKNDYYLSEITNDRGKKIRIKQDHLYLGAGYGKNMFEVVQSDGSGGFKHFNRQLYYARASMSVSRFNFGLNIGNSIVSGDVSYILK